MVKLKDKDKEEKARIDLEAVPNPTEYFTNVIVSFDYSKGTATLYDLSGRTISRTEIKGEKTIPVDLTNLPTGIYVVEIKTDTETGGVKVIKK
ncbi:T9SS type A sorting domain-containing protein [Flavobacterium sediminis]|uniref:T9SS type A sorting domain-containing protein n=1 Tax=Flavobacterium sediminis TaxID=2201181 RepID=UPI001FE28A98|nr:T9SS type A sorting domain-containing protein [Flavobacterium sediminis]